MFWVNISRYITLLDKVNEMVQTPEENCDRSQPLKWWYGGNITTTTYNLLITGCNLGWQLARQPHWADSAASLPTTPISLSTKWRLKFIPDNTNFDLEFHFWYQNGKLQDFSLFIDYNTTKNMFLENVCALQIDSPTVIHKFRFIVKN